MRLPNSILRPLLAAVLTAGTLIVVACSSSGQVSQCTTDGECDKLLGVAPGAGACVSGICQPKTGVAAEGGAPVVKETCESTAKCKEQHPNEKWVCLKPGEDPCVKLTSPECDIVSPTWDKLQPGSPIILGTVMSLDIKEADGTLVPSPYDIAQTKSIALAEEEFQSQTGGIVFPGKTERSPIVTVTCNAKSDPNRISAALDHLKSIGANSVIMRSTVDVKVAMTKAIANKQLIYATDVPAASITGSQGLLWHSMSDLTTTIGPAMSYYINQMETKRKAEGPLAGGAGANLKVAYLSTSFAPWKVMGDYVAKTATFNGKLANAQPNDFMRIETPDAQEGATIDFQQYVQALVAFKPDVIVMITGFHSLTEYTGRIEAAWPNGVPKPQYIMGPDELDYDRMDTLVNGNEALRKRVSGVSGWTLEATDANLLEFRARYKARYLKETVDDGGGESGYEAYYALAYANIDAINNPTNVSKKITGEDLAVSLKALRSSPEATIVDFKPTSITQAIERLRTRQRIDLRGIYSELEWDDQTGAPTIDAAHYCPVYHDGNFDFGLAFIWNYKSKAVYAPFDPSGCDW